MKAIFYCEYGSADVLRVSDVEKPMLKDGDVLIKIHAVEVTKADCELRSFNFPVKWFWLPLRLAMGISAPRKQVLGNYFAGKIESVGQAVEVFKPGDRIFGTSGVRFGAYAEYICLPQDCTLSTMPKNLSDEEAASIPLGGLNALHFMRKANIRQGDKVLINGAGGSIGILALQIAKSMGAEVTAVDSAIKKDMLISVGADHFIDYEQENFTRNGLRYDVIFNMVAGSSYFRSINSLRSKGRYLLGNPSVGDILKSVITSIFTDKTAIFAMAAEKVEELVTLKDMIESETITPVIDTVYKPEQAAEAHRRVETEQRVGMVVISFT